MSDEQSKPRDEAHWAKQVKQFHVGHDVPADALNLNVEGRRVAAMAGGFGKMYQVTYRVRLQGCPATPAEVVKVWKENFASFWPKKNKFFGPSAAMAPGDVALLNVKAGGVRLSTGVLVLYSDEESFSFMTPEGHMFCGMITFSAYADDGATTAQIQALIRAQDPIYELGMSFGGKSAEDRQWRHVLRSLAAHFSVEADPSVRRVVVDRKRQWSQWRNVKSNAGLRSGLHTAAAPIRALTKPFRQGRHDEN